MGRIADDPNIHSERVQVYDSPSRRISMPSDYDVPGWLKNSECV